MSKIQIFHNDVPDGYTVFGDLAIDTEAMGLKVGRDRLCLVQISDASGKACAVHFSDANYSAAINLKKILLDATPQKIMHFARFDMRIIKEYLDVELSNVFCTHIASIVARTYASNHSLKDLCKDLLNIQLNKYVTCSDWGAPNLSSEQIDYALGDILHLHKLKSILEKILVREDRLGLVLSACKALAVRIDFDLCGWAEVDIFDHYRNAKK